MVTTTTASVSSMVTKNNNGNMLLYNNNATNVSISNSSAGVNSCNSSSVEQYRLQLYNYALNMERLRGPPYTAAAIAAAAACALTTTEPTASATGSSVHDSNYRTLQVAAPPYICATASGLIATPSHMRHTSTLAQCPSNRLALASMSLFPQRFFQPEEPKPQHSYIGLIAMAILSSAENKLVLSDIYQYILDNYPYFRTRGPGWRNSIRHNLSLNDCFIKSGRSANGKGHYWAIHQANMDDFRKGDFRRRKAQRKVRKHMGLAVEDNAIDSPSPPPAMDLVSHSSPSLPQYCSSIITPIATAAQQLAAHSFGWHFTHHRPQHHNPQPATHSPAASDASYMGQIFTYKPQQHNGISTQDTTAAASMCNSNTTQKYHHQQHLIATTTTTSHHQQIENFEQNQRSISFISPSFHNKSKQRETSSATNANAISELFSQKRKRQFDVASLLAPDNTHRRDHNLYIRNGNLANPEEKSLRFHDDDDENPKSNDLDIEDIDVVDGSEEEYIEADFEQDEDDIYCNSHDEEESVYTRNVTNAHSRRLKNHCVSHLNTSDDESKINIQEHKLKEDNADKDNLAKKNCGDDFSIKNNQTQYVTKNNINCTNIKNICILKQSPPVSAYEFFTHSQYQRHKQTSFCLLSPATFPAVGAKTTTSLSHATVNQIIELNDHTQNLNQLPLNDAHQLIGRYYDTYIAAAAAARINSCDPATIVGKID